MNLTGNKITLNKWFLGALILRHCLYRYSDRSRLLTNNFAAFATFVLIFESKYIFNQLSKSLSLDLPPALPRNGETSAVAGVYSSNDFTF